MSGKELVTENICNSTTTISNKVKCKGLDDHPDSISQFILCVKKRPPLYNYKLPPHERRRTDVARIWEELAEEIGNVTASECRKKWKNLRDTFHQYRLRKMKFKDLLEKWRYSSDLSFLTEIYQPRLKCQRAGYLKNANTKKYKVEVFPSSLSTSTNGDDIYQTLNDSNDKIYKFDEVDPSALSTKLVVHDDVSDGEDEANVSVNEDALVEDDYEESIEHVIEMDDVQFCDVQAIDGGIDVNSVKLNEDSYNEVHLYEEADSNLVEYETEEVANKTSKKGNTLHCFSTSSHNQHLTIDDNKDELDLFFQFLKTKIQKLPSVDITAIQIEFLNAVLKREAANSNNTDEQKTRSS